MFWASFQSFSNHEFLVKLNLPIFVVLVGQQEKSQKYIDLSDFNYNLNDSNPWSSLGVMNFQKWELLSGSPGTLPTKDSFFPRKCKWKPIFSKSLSLSKKNVA